MWLKSVSGSEWIGFGFKKSSALCGLFRTQSDKFAIKSDDDDEEEEEKDFNY